jgi:23S rRNA pseudouridine1911/1915/1917 synthase
MTDAPDQAGQGARHEFVLDDAATERLDLLVAHRLDLSRTQAATLIAQGLVTVDGRREKASFRAEAGAAIAVDMPPPPVRTVTGESIALSVVFEDDDMLVIDKPAGMVVHPAPGNWTGTLVNALMGRGSALPGTGDQSRAGLIHRLDKETSGLLMVAKTDRAQRKLSADMAARRIERRYAALSVGHLGVDRRRVDAPVGRDPRERRRMAIDAEGRRAVTDFIRMARFDSCELLQARLQTGRTHQIRIHLASIGHPVAGDDTYGGGGARKTLGLPPKRHFLHAAWLRFRHPVTDEPCDLRSELPPDLTSAIARAAQDPTLIEHPHPLDYLGFFQGDG